MATPHLKSAGKWNVASGKDVIAGATPAGRRLGGGAGMIETKGWCADRGGLKGFSARQTYPALEKYFDFMGRVWELNRQGVFIDKTQYIVYSDCNLHNL